MTDEQEEKDDQPPMWESYGRFKLMDGKPLQWLEISGDQNALINNLGSSEGVFGVEIYIPNPEGGAIQP